MKSERHGTHLSGKDREPARERVGVSISKMSYELGSLLVAARATNQTSDKQPAAAMMEETIDNVGAVPREVSADAGYYSAKAVGELHALGVDEAAGHEGHAVHVGGQLQGEGLRHRRCESMKNRGSSGGSLD